MGKKLSITLSFAVLMISALIYQNCSAGFIVSKLDSSLFSSSTGTGTVRRVSNLEYKRCLLDVLQSQFARHGNQPATNVYWDYSSSIQGALSEVPGDALATKLGTDQLAFNLSPSRFTAYVDTAYAIGVQIANDQGRLQNLVGMCATGDTDLSNSTCLDQFITDFATLAFRTPPTADERAELKKGLTDWHTLIARILLHPRFLLHYERDGKRTTAGAYLLTDYELEARLTSVFWKSSPDVAGLKVAASGELRTDAGLKNEVNRILSADNAKSSMWAFYQQWLGVSRLPVNGVYDTGVLFEAFASPYTAAQLNSALRDAVLDDGRQFLDYLTWTQPSTLETLFRSPLLFTTNSALASIYGISPRASTADSPISDPTGHFRGILTRALITQQKPSNNGEVNHIQRGVFVLENLMGLDLGQPANFADQQQAQLVIPLTASTRQEVVTKTSVGSCIGCHTTINPSGFGLANYDSIGRYVTTESRFRTINNVTTQVANNPIDAAATLPLNGVAYSVKDVSSLVDAMFASGRVYDGFASYYFQFVFGHIPTSDSDIRLLTVLKTNLKTKSIHDSLVALALAPDFAFSR